jgi:prepilin-type N-terminal cleavage/methylation domain-containing protein
MTSPRATHLSTRRRALADETGFTFVELLVTLAILGVLLAIAVPAYLNFQAKAQSTAALSDVREVIPSANAYYVENSSFTGMTPHSLRAAYDSGLMISSGGSTGIVSANAEAGGASFCISAVSDGHWAHYSGPRRNRHRRPEHGHREPLLVARGVRWSHGGSAWPGSPGRYEV